MDDPKRIILDISSDEEVGWGESGVTCRGGVGGVRDDVDWISELLDEVEKETDDADEVLVVGAVIANPKQRVAKSLAKCVDNEEEEDDDCVVLDGDPDKPIAIENDGGEDSDDLCVVGEKGQVACRDYPHPRHLCVKFPFDSTPHERHCDQCHCYVCDTVAPCVHWGNGVSSIDHCHATEKDEFWTVQRKGSKTSYKAPLVVSGMGLTPMNQVQSLPNNPLMHNQELPASQPCSSTCIGTPKNVMPVRIQETGYDQSNKFQPHLVSHHLRRNNAGHAGNRFISQPVPFKRPGMVGGLLTSNRCGNNSSRNHYRYQFPGNQSPGSRQDPRARGNSTLSTYQGSNQATFGGVAAYSVSNSPTTPMGNALGNYASSQPQLSSQIHGSSVNLSLPRSPHLSSQTCTGSNIGNLMPTLPGVATQQGWGSPFENLMSLQPQAASQPNVGRTYQNVVPSQPLVTSHGNINYSSECPAPVQAVVSFQPSTNSASQNPLSHQPRVSGQPPRAPSGVQNGFRQGNQAQNPLHSSYSDVNINQDSPMSQNSQYLSVECPQLQGAILREKSEQLPPSSNPHSVNFQFDSWSLEHKSALEDLDIPLLPGFDVFSPEFAPVDAGLFFDI